MKENSNQNANLKIKKLDLGLKVVKKKFLTQIKLLKYSPKDKISHVLLRNTLIFHNTIHTVKTNTDFMYDCVSKIKKNGNNKNFQREKTKLKKQVNDKQIINYALIKNLMNLFNTYSIFDHDFEIETLSNKNETNVLEKIPKEYHTRVKDELRKIKPNMPNDLKKDEKIIEGFADPFSQAIDTIIGGIKSVIGEIEKGINVVKDFVLDIIDKIQDIFMKIFGFMEDIFKQLKEIVEFIGGFLMQVIDIFFKILKFIWLLITEWIPWLVTEIWKFMLVWLTNYDILLFAFILQFPLDDMTTKLADMAIPYSGSIAGELNVGQMLSFYLFWIYPKSLRLAQNWIFDRIKMTIIYMVEMGKSLTGQGFSNTSQDAARAMQEIFMPSWFIDLFRLIPPKMNEDISGWTSDNISITKKAENFLMWLLDNIVAIPAKLIIMLLIAMSLHKFVWPHISYPIPSLKELSQFPVVILRDIILLIKSFF